MAQQRYHSERAFEAYLRCKRMPYVAVNEARQALLPMPVGGVEGAAGVGGAAPEERIKSFDFVVYGPARNLLVEVKGRRLIVPPGAQVGQVEGHLDGRSDGAGASGGHRHRRRARGHGHPRCECWATERDVADLLRWQTLFGEGFESVFVFVYGCDRQPADGVFQEVFEFEERWYALRAIPLVAYARQMKVRSPRWGTVDLPTRIFEQESDPFAPAYVGLEDGPLEAGVQRDGVACSIR